jgi:hypothetical protein
MTLAYDTILRLSWFWSFSLLLQPQLDPLPHQVEAVQRTATLHELGFCYAAWFSKCPCLSPVGHGMTRITCYTHVVTCCGGRSVLWQREVDKACIQAPVAGFNGE